MSVKSCQHCKPVGEDCDLCKDFDRYRPKPVPPGVREGEVWIDTVGGEKIAFPSYESEDLGVAYVRFLDERGVELLVYFDKEWEEDPRGTMGAILGAMMVGASPWKKERISG